MDTNKNTSSSERLQKNIDYAGLELLGSRETQEDYSSFRSLNTGTELLAVLADGMGGHTGGEIASKKAVDSFDATFNGSTSVSVPVRLGAALQQANNDLAVAIQNSPALEGMGCTLVGMHIGAQGLHWISVGDSPLFLYRGSRVSRLNADHSMTPVIAESLRMGRITKEEAARHPHLHALRSSVTGGGMELIDTPVQPVALQEGDVLILASDGLLTLSKNEIALVLKDVSDVTAENLAKALITAVEKKKKPRQDNTTVQVVIVPSSLDRSYVKPLTLWIIFAMFGISFAAFFVPHWWTIEEPNLPPKPEPSTVVTEPRPTPVPAPVPVPVPVPVPPPPTSKQPVQPAVPANDLPQADKKKNSPKAPPKASQPVDKAGEDGPSKGQGLVEKPALPADETSSQGGGHSNKSSTPNQSTSAAPPEGAIAAFKRGEIWTALLTLFGLSR